MLKVGLDSCWCMAKPIQYCKVKKKKVDLVGKMVQNFRRDIETVKSNRDHWIKKKYSLKQNFLDEVKIWLVKIKNEWT